MTKICACLMIAALLFCCLFAACTPKNDVNEALKDTLKIEILKIGKADCSIITDGTTSIVVDCGEEDKFRMSAVEKFRKRCGEILSDEGKLFAELLFHGFGQFCDEFV